MPRLLVTGGKHTACGPPRILKPTATTPSGKRTAALEFFKGTSSPFRESTTADICYFSYWCDANAWKVPNSSPPPIHTKRKLWFGERPKSCEYKRRKPNRRSQHVPEEFTAPLELQQRHFGLVDDYGIKPKHPKFRTWTQHKESEKLHKVHKSKRDEPNFEEYYYDDLL
ncbi:hypothetical protein JRQ81_000619 [Phrynocephalus forsythii]|uniref:Uncharacterized protein n=1 Tax=Phrynocephalus forsythii TaxID=171643 RepID=A0A9Q1B882_9SAUR|nr:hypothetical protein JRQ81_000619 [Phrynocephalus forsythii]